MDGAVISEHFGKTKQFLFVTFEGKNVLSREVLPPPAEEHIPGLFPNWVKKMGADIVVAAGMGSQAKRMFESLGVKVLTVPSIDVEKGIEALLEGSLNVVETDCGHGHDSACGK
jgi:predicted Fe-Mo cluster-binding NifX family protein